MRRLGLVLGGVLLLAGRPAAAQSSIFGARGLGVPTPSYSARTITLGGATASFDALSGLNPAALAGYDTLTAVFTGVQSFRTSDDPGGSATGRDARFPHMMIVSPIRRTGIVLGLSLSSYLTRDFSLASVDTIAPRGQPLVVSDTFSSRGGISQIRLGGGWQRPGSPWAVGVAVQVLTGTNRLNSHAGFSDSAYTGTRQSAELSYAGYGAALGIRRSFGSRLTLAAQVGTDHNVKVDLDSTRLSQVDLPITLGGGIQWRSSRLTLAGQALWRSWSDADLDVRTVGGYGAFNTVELGGGLELVRNARRPYQFPLRLGARYATLPFAITPGLQPHEYGFTLGTGTRFAAQRGGIDLGVEHIRRSGGVGYRERAWRVVVGVSVRP